MTSTLNLPIGEPQANALLMRVNDTEEYFGRVTDLDKAYKTVLAEAFQSFCESDLFVVSYETGGCWHVFVGQVAVDHGIVETADGLHLRSLVMRPTEAIGTRL